MGILGKRAQFETIRSIDTATFTGTYQALGTVISNPAVLIWIVNNSDRLATFTDDGTNDKFVIVAGGFLLLDVGSDSQSVSGDMRLAIKQGTQFSVKGTAGGTGSIYLSAMYVGG